VRGFFESLRCELRHRGSAVHLTMVQLPAHNTPQFVHSRARVDRHPQPVPPIYQPEVAARAVSWSVRHRRRELYVGAPAVMTILGNKLAPGIAEWWLARTGYDSQLTDALPFAPDRPDNLFAPAERDEGAHGPFDDQAHARSAHAWASMHRRALGLAGAGAALAGWALRRGAR
jgi:hypothetical protein